MLNQANAGDVSCQCIRRGKIVDWNGIEQLWQHVFDQVLQVGSSETPVLFAEPAATSESDRARMAEILFEKFNVPSYFVGFESVFSVYSAGRTSSLVVDTGHAVTSAMVVSDGWIIPPTLQQLDIGGQDIETYLGELISDKTGALLPTDQTRSIKHTAARVALDYAKQSQEARKHEEAVTLPDGTQLALSGEQFRCCEALFYPAMLGQNGNGLHEMVIDLMEYCDKDKEGGPIRTLSNFVLTTGGTAYLPGLEQRLKQELVSHRGSQHEMYVLLVTLPSLLAHPKGLSCTCVAAILTSHCIDVVHMKQC
jgi:actin-related protein